MKSTYKMLKYLVCALFITTSSAALSQSLNDGTYVTQGDSHYLDGKMTFEAWGNDSFDMKATLVDGSHQYETTAFLELVKPGEYRGSGKITVRYSPNSGCKHKFGIRVFVENDGQIFVRENTPRYIPFNPNGPCTAAGPYVWFNHPEAYFMQDYR